MKNVLDPQKERILPGLEAQPAARQSIGSTFQPDGASMATGIADPLGLARLVVRMLESARELDLAIKYSSDFEQLDQTRLKARSDRVSPLFDPSVSQLDDQRAFWMGAFDSSGRPVSLQAFRLDIVYPN